MSCTFEPAYPYQNLIRLIVPSILVLNHLTAYFYFGPRFTFPFRLFSVIFLIVGSVIIFSDLFGSMPHRIQCTHTADHKLQSP